MAKIADIRDSNYNKVGEVRSSHPVWGEWGDVFALVAIAVLIAFGVFILAGWLAWIAAKFLFRHFQRLPGKVQAETGLALLLVLAGVGVYASVQNRPESYGAARADEAPSADLTPIAAQPRPVTSPTFVVNTMPVGCHEAPRADARIVAQIPLGAVQAMDQVVAMPDGTWHREVDRKCWVRTSPGPVQTFGTLTEAERAAQPYRAAIPAGGRPPVIAVGSRIRVAGLGASDCVNLRQEPSVQGKVLNCLRNWTTMQVMEGPRDLDGWRWWRVSLGGWVVDTYLVVLN